ncbi:trypsin-like serine peptidase [Denitrobaculum tricleocarpae]|nr:trypsin-like serine protease [Denitrobaculum tricleocarpae]
MPDSVIVNAREYPWSAIGRLNTGGRGFCTGVLVDAYYVLADAHCLFYRTEGRWWQPNELHFVAGYQRDTNVVHARVSGYELAPGYRAHGGVSLASILNNWALLKLEKPLGHQTGWLGLKNLNRKLIQRIKKGRGALLQAGYRRNAPHAITLGLDCGPKGFFAAESRIGHRCQLKPGRADLPFLVYMDGKFNLVANHVISSITRQPPRTGPLASARFRTRLTRGESRAPESGATASPVPTSTISNLLETLGHSKSNEDARAAQVRETAIQSFEVSEGLPVTGKASLTLLGKILETVY